MFTDLHFTVRVENDLTRDELVHCMKVESLHNHQDYSCFVCCILSHGTTGAIHGTDGRTVPIKDLTGYFKASSCPSLRGKPKMFFIQACQGAEKQISCPCKCLCLWFVYLAWIIRSCCNFKMCRLLITSDYGNGRTRPHSFSSSPHRIASFPGDHASIQCLVSWAHLSPQFK